MDDQEYDKNLRNSMVEIFTNVQDNVSTHQKHLQTLKALYKSNDLDDFVNEFVRCLEFVFVQDHKESKSQQKLIFTFAAKFCLDVLLEHENEVTNSCQSDEEEENPFLDSLVMKILPYTELSNINCRYHSSLFINILLDTIGNLVRLSSKLCDDIQNALLDKLQDGVLGIRTVCIGALSRLQEPDHPTNECPVIMGFIQSFEDSSPLIRKEVISKVALTQLTVAKIIERIRDVDSTVRVAVYNRIGTFELRSLRIPQRQHILLCGLEEEQKSVKTAFEKAVLLKWLQSHDNSIIAFMHSLILDADDQDVKQTQFISEKVLEVFFKILPLDTIIKTLPLDEKKLVPIDQINLEIITYWYHLTVFLQNNEKLAPEIDSLLVELTVFCEYIENYIEINSTATTATDSSQYFNFQEVLYRLFSLASIADFTDEAGRRKLQSLITTTLINTKLEVRVIAKMLEIYKIFVPDVNRQCEEICTIISDIREPECVENASTEESGELTTNQKFEIAQLKVKLYTLEDEKSKALAENQFSEAERLHGEMETLRKKIEELATPPVREPEPIVTKELKTDTPTISRCLDILIAFLKITKIKKLPASLRSCLIEFVKPSTRHVTVDVFGKVFRIVGQFSVLDKEIAVDELKTICSPLVAYKHGRTDKASLISTMQGMSDIIRVHGPAVFGEDSDATFDINSTRRRLYRSSQIQDVLSDQTNITGGLIMDILLSLLDEEDDDIRHCATKCISKIVMQGLYVGPSLLVRLVLKWLNPHTEKHDCTMQQILGHGILKFASNIADSSSFFEKAIVPILNCIGNAPITSPLCDVDTDRMCTLLRNLTKVRCSRFSTVHKNLAFSILHEIKRKSTLKCVFILSKMLLYLDPPQADDETTLRELLNSVDPATDAIADKQAIRNLKKYKEHLYGLLNHEETRTETPVNAEDVADKENKDPEEPTNAIQENNNSHRSEPDLDSLNSSPSESMENNVSVVSDSMASNSSSNGEIEGKRKRGRPRKASQSDETTLHTILEQSQEVSKLSDDSDACSDVSRTSKRSSRNRSSSQTSATSQRTARKSARKKRIESSDSPDDGLRRSARKRTKKVR